MNILVIGNGFDLAHRLPTKYTDFLEFIELFTDTYKNVKNGTVDWGHYDVSKKVSMFLKKWFSARYNNENGQSEREKATTVKIIEELKSNIKDNIWIEYFLQCDMHGEENWIDFESEISKVVQSLDKDRRKFEFDYNTQLISNEFLNEKYYEADPPITYRQLRDKLLSDLNRLIRAFEIYLTEYVENINVEVISPDIKAISPLLYEDSGQQGALFSKVISFNYTNIYEQIYLRKHNINSGDYIDYIHGKADSNNTVETNNMVLGIDEYLGKKERNKQVEFIAFKKFYQRIHKGTGCKYKEWVDIIKEEFADYQAELEKCKKEKNIMLLKAATDKLKKQYLNKHHVYIFGHSLDVTDKDILRDLILNDNVHTTIFYHDKDAMGQQIANLVKVIGQDELIRRTGGSTRTIEFKEKQEMKEIEGDN